MTYRLERGLLAGAFACLALFALRCLAGVPAFLEAAASWSYNGAEFFAIALCGLRAYRAAGAERAAWIALAVGLAGYAAGDVYWTLALEGKDEVPYPSLADAGYLSIFPAAYAGLVLMLRASAPRLSRALFLDGLICALAGAAVGAALVFGVVASTEGPFATVATNLAYPLGDLTLLAFVIAVMVLTGRAAGSGWRLLAAAFAVYAIGDGLYLYQTALGSYREYTLLDLAWPAAFVLVALAATRPPVRLDTNRLRGGMLGLPALFTLAAVGLLIVDHYTRLHTLAMWLASGALLAAVVRYALTMRENLRTLDASEADAATDPLTGLGNRRALMRDLDRYAAFASPGRPVVLALFDLDGFKAYNDTFGHPRATRCSPGWGRTCARSAATPTGWAATNSACSRWARTRGASSARPPRSASRASASRSAAPTGRRRSPTPAWTRRTRCGWRTSACTRTSARGAAPATRSSTRCCCASPPSTTVTCASTSTTSPTSWAPSAASSGSPWRS